MSRFGNIKALQPSAAPPKPAGLATLKPPSAPARQRIPEVRPSAADMADQGNAPRKVGMLLLVAYVFVRFSYVTDILGYITGSKTFLILALGVPLVILTAISGGLFRALRAKPTMWFIALMAWMLIVIPFGYWRGGSVGVMKNALSTEFSILFIIAGTVFTLREFNRMAATIALAGAFVILASFKFGVSEIGRFSFAFGTLSNANDYATHLIVVLPFLLLVILNSKSQLARIGAVCAAFAGAFLVVRTGSRASLLSLGLVFLFLFLRGTQSQKIALGISIILVGAAAVVVLPRTTLMRYMLIMDSPVDDDIAADKGLVAAVGSGAQRRDLLWNSITMTAIHPLFGVGPGNFAPADAERASQNGQRGIWLLTHNTYTEISSETGVPGLVMFIGMLAATFAQIGWVYKKTRNRPEFKAIQNTASCLMLSLLGFCICIFFAAMSYRFYYAAMVGIVVCFTSAVQRELSRQPVPSVTGMNRPIAQRIPA